MSHAGTGGTVTGIVISGFAYYNGAIGIRPLRRLQGEAHA